MAGGGGGRSLRETPTWAVAIVCLVIVLISVAIEKLIDRLQKLFERKHKKPMLEALEKIKSELMLLGFISLFLAVAQKPVSKICVSEKIGTSMLPCRSNYFDMGSQDSGNRRRLLSDWEWERGRMLAGANDDYCFQFDKKVPLISQSGVHQLHIFIFVLAVFHVLYSVLTIGLAKAKIRKWKAWEKETDTIEYQYLNDPSRFRYTRQTSFVRRHGGLIGIPVIKWVVAFFRQFTGSVTKVDYLTLRHGFINAHLSPNSNFNFHEYIKRSLEDDLKVIVGISFPLWILVIATLLLNVYGWYSLYWLSSAPLMILLLVGTKLELVITKMATQIQENSPTLSGTPVVQPSNELFWFGHPEWILLLIHLSTFENAFQLSHFLWTWFSFGIKSCFHSSLLMTIIRLTLGILLQFMCSYITFPLYALVTQMGSSFKKAIFEDQITNALLRWSQKAKERRRLREKGIEVPSSFTNPMNTPSQGTSPVPLLQRHRLSDVENASSHVVLQRSQSDNNISVEELSAFALHGDSLPRREIHGTSAEEPPSFAPSGDSFPRRAGHGSSQQKSTFFHEEE